MFPKTPVSRVLFLLLALALAACGGRGEDGPAPPGIAEQLNGVTFAYHAEVDVAFTNSGDGLAVWEANSGLGSRVLYSCFRSAEGVWSAEAELVTDANEPHVASNGNTFMVMYKKDGRVRARAYDCSTWGDEAIISSVITSGDIYILYGLAIASNGSGYAAVWKKNNDVYASIHNGTGWEAETAIETGAGYASSLSIASDGAGYAVVWQVYDPTNDFFDIYASIHNGTDWEAETSVENREGQALDLSIASDGAGYAVAWQLHDLTNDIFDIYASIHNGTGWETETAIETGAGYALSPSIASDGSGYAVAWQQLDTTNAVYNIHASFHNGTGWEAKTTIDAGADAAVGPSIASNGSGYAVAWQQYDSTNDIYDIYAIIHNGTRWEAETIIEDCEGQAYSPSVASNVLGYAVAWYQDNGTFQSVYANMYDDGSWGPEADLVAGAYRGTSQAPDMTTNDTGTTLAVWVQYDGYDRKVHGSLNTGGTWGRPFVISEGDEARVASAGSGFMVVYRRIGTGLHAAMYNGTGWEAETLISGSYAAYGASVASNGSGYAMAWHQYDSTNSVYDIYASIHNGTGWEKESIIETGADSAFAPSIASNGSGYAVAWHQYDSTSKVYDIYANIHNGTGWEGEIAIETGADSAFAPSIASNGSGYAAAWHQGNDIYARIQNGTGWESEIAIENGTGNAYNSLIASNGVGYAVAWWHLGGDIYVNIHNGTRWEGKTAIETGAGDAYYPSITSNGTGYAVAWQQLEYPGTGNSIKMNKYSDGSWGLETSVDDAGTDARNPLIRSSGDGGYSVIWRQLDATDSMVWNIWALLGL